MHLPPRSFPDDDFYVQVSHIEPSNAGFVDPFLDVLGDDNQLSPHFTHSDNPASLDSRRLQTQHTTEGYRDGITAGKVESIQAGFDEGFSLGANVGLKAGQLLGLLEGLSAALKEHGLSSSTSMDQLVFDAAKDLSTDSIFSEQFWTSDGGWKYPVIGSRGNGDVLFEDVAREHPIIMKWQQLVDQEIKGWSLERNFSIPSTDGSQSELPESSPNVQGLARQAVDW
ncbi:hypothetical protein M426DRAFT_317975 [Hypoxylon sp. CI-4A]|nr:hypothetical protein M426DRAFT_317975 [Hypoxylon sp. CI-4A]